MVPLDVEWGRRGTGLLARTAGCISWGRESIVTTERDLERDGDSLLARASLRRRAL
jgi:hypothetical protein